MMFVTGGTQTTPARDGLNVTFFRVISPKFSAIPSTAGPVKLQSETVRDFTESGRLPLVKPIRKVASDALPLQFLTSTLSIVNFAPPFVVYSRMRDMPLKVQSETVTREMLPECPSGQLSAMESSPVEKWHPEIAMSFAGPSKWIPSVLKPRLCITHPDILTLPTLESRT